MLSQRHFAPQQDSEKLIQSRSPLDHNPHPLEPRKNKTLLLSIESWLFNNIDPYNGSL